MKMRQCLFCKKSKNKLHYIINKDGEWNNEIKADLVKFLDEDVETCLEANDSICEGCWSVINSIIKLKNRLWRHISIVCNNRDREVLPVDLEKLSGILTAIRYDEDLEDDNILGKISTPDLITPTGSTPYNVTYESLFERAQSARSLNGEEYWAVINGKRSPRTRSYSTDPDFGRYTRKRPRSVMSTRSLKGSSCNLAPIKTYDLEKNYDKQPGNFYCPEQNCFLSLEPFVSLKTYTFHLTKHHNAKARFTCTDCQEKFLSKQHLRFHKEKYIVTHMGPVVCDFCDILCRNSTLYQQHIEKHFRFSISCKFCEKSYLNELDYYEHMKKVHKGQRASARWTPMVLNNFSTIKRMVFYKEGEDNNEEEHLLRNINECEFIEMEQDDYEYYSIMTPNL